MSFPSNVAEKALLDCGRCCCICHKFCGVKIELHHIIQKLEEGEDSYENCIPLCLDCHAEVKAYNPKHPKGRKYTESELRGHRARWYARVKNKSFSLIHPECIELDRKVFLTLKEILPTKVGSIPFIRRHYYNGPWLVEVHNDLREYLSHCEHPDFEFIDSELESHRCKLTECIEQFIDILGEVSFTTDQWNSEYKEMAVDPYKKNYHRDIYDQIVIKIHNSAQDVCSAYDNLIRLGRRKLGID